MRQMNKCGYSHLDIKNLLRFRLILVNYNVLTARLYMNIIMSYEEIIITDLSYMFIWGERRLSECLHWYWRSCWPSLFILSCHNYVCFREI